MSNGLKIRRGKLSRAGAASAVPLIVLALCLVGSGCKSFSIPFFGGANLTDSGLKQGRDLPYAAVIQAQIPVLSETANTTMNARLEVTSRVRVGQVESAEWARVEAEVTGARYDVDGKPYPVSLVGNKLSFKCASLRRISAWPSLFMPIGLELLEISLPHAKVRKGESWKGDGHRLLLQQGDDLKFVKEFRYTGDTTEAGEACYRVSVTIAPTTATLPTGALLDFVGSGEVLISKKDGRVVKATEVLEGTIRNDKLSREPGRFVHAMALASGTVIPGVPAASGAKPSVPAVGAAPIASATTVSVSAVATPPHATLAAVLSMSATALQPGLDAAAFLRERIIYVSRSTGKRQVWSVSPDGTDKRCLTGHAFEHWMGAPDPSGRVLACVSRRAAGVNIWAYALERGIGEPLTSFSENEDVKAGWSKEGRRLIFLKGGRLWSIHLEGYDMQNYGVEGTVKDFCSVPVSQQIIAVQNVLNQNLLVSIDVISAVSRELFEGDLPALSADGTKLAYRNGDYLFASNSDGTLNKQVSKVNIADAPIFWSPDGSRLAMTIIGDGDENVSLLDVAAGTVKPVTTRGGSVVGFSPGGDRIAYILNGDLWIASTDGSAHTLIVPDGSTEGPVFWGKTYVP